MTSKTGQLSIEVGRFTVKSVERTIKRTAFDWGLEVYIQKDMGLVDGLLMITVKGDSNRVAAYIRTLEDTFKGVYED